MVIGSFILIPTLLLVGNMFFEGRIEEAAQVANQENVQAEGEGDKANPGKETLDGKESADKSEGDRSDSRNRVQDETNEEKEEDKMNSVSESRGGERTNESTRGSSGTHDAAPQNREASNRHTVSTNLGTDQSNQSVSNKSSAEIHKKYVGIFQQLEFQQSGQMNQLIAEAEAEAIRKGINNVDRMKYRSRAQAIEANAEAEFHRELNNLRSELRANGHKESMANEFENRYEQRKAARLQELEARASGY